jgi:hypothetical protein
MIAEIDYNYRLLNAAVRIFTPNKQLMFTSWSQHKLRELTNYTQQRVMEIRQYYMGQQSQEERIAETAVNKKRTFIPNMALQANVSTLQHAGRLSVDSAAKSSMPMHNPYAQVPLISRHWSSRRPQFGRS